MRLEPKDGFTGTHFSCVKNSGLAASKDIWHCKGLARHRIVSARSGRRTTKGMISTRSQEAGVTNAF
jgi:hypothetical protein